MKCKICKNKTSWDESFGKASYIVCRNCFKKLAKRVDKNDDEAGILLNIIFEMGTIREEERGKQFPFTLLAASSKNT